MTTTHYNVLSNQEKGDHFHNHNSLICPVYKITFVYLNSPISKYNVLKDGRRELPTRLH